MGIFSKTTDPAEKAQRDLDAKLKAKRASRDDLIQRRATAETNASAHREKATALAAEGAADTALSAAESAMRREQDRAATLTDAITAVETTIASLEAEIAMIEDGRLRVETSQKLKALVSEWTAATSAFDTAVSHLVALATETETIIIDAHPLRVFLSAVQEQTAPEIAMISGILRDHAKGVLAGTVAAVLPKPLTPEPVKIVEQPSVERMFAMKVVRWVDAHGVAQICDQYADCDLTPSAARNGRRCNAVVPTDDPRCSKLRGVHGGRHPNPAHAVDLDDGTAYSRQQVSAASIDANIVVLDRGPAITGTIPVSRAI